MFSRSNPNRVRNLVLSMSTLFLFLCLCCSVSAIASWVLVDQQIIVPAPLSDALAPQADVPATDQQAIAPAVQQAVVPAVQQAVAPADTQVADAPATMQADSQVGDPAMCGGVDAPQDKATAAKCFGVSPDSLTELNASAGDPYVIGWVVGRPPYVTSVTAYVRAQTCADFAPSTSVLTNPAEWTEDYAPVDWRRTFTSGEGNFTGYKLTLYWTPCQRRDLPSASSTVTPVPTLPALTPIPPTATPAPTALPAPTATPARLCPLPDVPGTWKSIEDGCAFVAQDAVFDEYLVPQGVRIDYDAGGKEGQAIAGSKLTYSGVATFRYLDE